MVKIPSEAGPLVLLGVIASAWLGTQQQAGTQLEKLVLAQASLTATAETITVTGTNTDGSPFSGTVQIVTASGTVLDNVTLVGGTGTGTELRISMDVVIAAMSGSVMSNTITIPALTTVTLSSIVIAQNTLTPTAESFSVTATQSDGTGWTGSANVQTVAGTVLAPVQLTNGSGITEPFNRTQTPVQVEVTAQGVISNVLIIPAAASQAALTISRASLTATDETINVAATNALGVAFNGTVNIVTAAGTILDTVTITNGIGTSKAIPRKTTAQVVHAEAAGLPTSNNLTIPALVTITSITIARVSSTPTTATVRVTIAPTAWTGTVNIVTAAGTVVASIPHFTGGTGTAIVDKIQVSQTVHAEADGKASGTLVIAALASQAVLSISPGTISAGAEAVDVSATNALGVPFSGNVNLVNSSTGTVLSTVAVTNGTGTGSVTRIQTAQTVQARSAGLPNSNTITVPALASQATLSISAGTLTATSENIDISATNALGVPFTGTVNIVSASGTVLDSPAVTNGTGTGNVIRIGVALVVHAEAAGLPTSNFITVPAAVTQTAQVQVFVFNNSTGVGIRAAAVRLASATNTYNATSDTTGTATFNGVLFDNYNLFASAGTLTGGKALSVQATLVQTNLGLS